MKLHNLLLTAALFVTATIASAATTFDNYSYTPENGKVKMTVFVISNGWDFALYGYDQNNNGTKLLDINTKDKDNALTIDQINAKNLPSEYKQQIIDSINTDSGYYHAYDLEVPVNDDIVKIGLMGSNNANQEKMIVYSIANKESHNGFYFSSLSKDNNVIAYGGGALEEGAVFLMGDSAPVGSPLPAPVVTLLIALGFGAALVMYRNRKQIKA